jgi:hypothetical protein
MLSPVFFPEYQNDTKWLVPNGHAPEGIAAQEKGVLARFGSVSDALASAALCVF